MKKIIQFLSVLFSILFLYTLLLNSNEIRRLYHLYYLFDGDNISENFQNMSKFYSTNLTEKGASVSELKLSDKSYNLPETFSFENFDVSSNYFLRYTNTNALLILHNNSLVYENYFVNKEDEDDQQPEGSLFISWSVVKSFMSILTAIAIEEGDISNVNDLASDYIPELKNTAYRNVSIKQLLQMTTGVEFSEDYDNFFSDVNIFSYYLSFGLPMSDFVKTLKSNTHQGQHQYASIDTQVLGMVVTKATGQSLSSYLSEKLWQPLGMGNDALWMTDATGMEFAPGGLNASAKDYARFGQLIANGGSVNGKQIVQSNWISELGKPENTVTREDYEDYDYSNHWWVPKNTIENEIIAIGIYDQYIYINRDENIVIVKLSANPNYLKDDYISEKQSLNFFRSISKSLSE